MDFNQQKDQNNLEDLRDQNTIQEEIPIPEFSYGPQEQMYTPPQKKGMAVKILIAVVSLVVVVFLAVGIAVVYFRNTPAYRIGKGIQNLGRELEECRNPLTDKIGVEEILLMMVEEGSHVNTEMNFTSEGLFGTTVGIDTDYVKDVERKELSADTSISVMNYDLAHLQIYADEEAFCFSIPELFMENMYIENEDVVSQYNQSFLSEVTGRSEMDDFSIDFFGDMEDGLSLREWKNLDQFEERYEEDLEACRDKMVMEKVERGVYRMIYPAREMNRLIKGMMGSYEEIYEMAGEKVWWEDYDRLIDSDVQVLFEMDGKNRIESISFDGPIVMMDGEASMEGALHFLGTARSIDKVQGEIAVEGVDGVERSIHCQILLQPSKDCLEMELDIDLMEEKDSILRAKYEMESDAVRDEFALKFSVWDDEEDMELMLEGSLDDVVRGRSVDLELEKLALCMDGEELCKVTGKVLIEPLQEEITSEVRRETAFFEMTEEDWLTILYKISGEYGSMLDYLW